MDNSPIDTSKDWMKFFREQNCKIVIFSPYWPQFVAIQMIFNVMKLRLWMQSRQEIINLSKPIGIMQLERFTTFSSENIIKYWTKAISNIRWELTKLICNISKNKSIELHY